jgi:hypothetical protein
MALLAEDVSWQRPPWPCHHPGMGRTSSDEAAEMADAAKQALADGQSLFVLKLKVEPIASNARGPVYSSLAEQLEAVEDAGFRLEHVSHFGRVGGVEGVYVFRAVPNRDG